MNRSPDVELVLREWFADDGAPAPDYLLDAVEERISHQSQRRTWRLQGRQTVTTFKLAAALAAALIIAVVGWNLLPRGASSGGVPTPTPTPLASAAEASPASWSCDEPGCSGPLEAGTHAAAHFEPGLAFTTSAGWNNSVDLPDLYMLTNDALAPDYLMVWSKVAISQHTDSCEPLAAPGVGNAVQDWIDYVTSQPGILARNVAPVQIGGFDGQVVDVDVRPEWTRRCPNLDFASVQFIMHADGGVGGTYGAAAGLRLRLYILDVAGETVLILHYGGRAEPDDVVASMRFSPTPA